MYSQNKKIFKIFISILIFTILCLLFIKHINFPSDNTKIKLVEGKVDLLDINLDKYYLDLNGEWEFYYNQILYPTDFKYSFVPNYSYLSEWGNLGFSHTGVATYRAIIKKPTKYKDFGLKISDTYGGYKLFINGELKTSNYDLSVQNIKDNSRLLSDYHYFTSSSDTIEIIIQVSNYEFFKGGLLKPPVFGLYRNIQILRDFDLILSSLLIFSLLTLSIFLFSLYLARENENGLLCLSLTSITFIIRIFISSSGPLYFVYYLVPYAVLLKIFYSFNVLSTYLIFLYFKNNNSIKKDFIATIIEISVLIYFIAVAISNIKYLNILYFFGTSINCLIYLYFFIKSTIALFHFKEKAVFNFMGSLILLISFSIDIYNLNISIYRMIALVLFTFFVLVEIIKTYNVNYKNLNLIKSNLETELSNITAEFIELNDTLVKERSEYLSIQEHLGTLSNIDQLTGIFNGVYGLNYLDDLVSTYIRHSHSFSIILLDLDNLKFINDTFGRFVGDKVLVSTTLVINSLLRRTDVLSRFGGDEFLIIMPNCTKENAFNVAEKVRCAISSNIVDDLGSITASIGIATIHSEDDSKSILQRASDNLEMAKELGKNNVYPFM